MILYFDSETSTRNKGHPFDPTNLMVSYSFFHDSSPVCFKYYKDPDFHDTVYRAITSASEYIGVNPKFDLHWLQRHGIRLPVGCRVWAVELAEFVISGQTARFMSLNQALESYGLPLKPDKVKEDYWANGISTEDIPVAVLEEYGNYDVTCLPELVAMQKAIMSPAQINLVYLLGQDLLTLQEAEFNGIKFDYDNAKLKVDILETEIVEIDKKLQSYVAHCPSEFTFNWSSGDHLSALIYGGTINYVYPIPEEATYKSGPNKGQSYTKNKWFKAFTIFPQRFRPLPKTEVKKTKDDPNATTRFYQTDDPTLKQLRSRKKEDNTLLSLLADRGGKLKIVEMIRSIMNKAQELNWSDGCIHPQFNQNIAITGRLSSSAPNMQNTPLEIDELLVSRYD